MYKMYQGERHVATGDEEFISKMIKANGDDFGEIKDAQGNVRPGRINELKCDEIWKGPSGSIYKISEPELVGKSPIRTELTVIPADSNKKSIGWTCREYLGAEIYLLNLLEGEIKPIETPLSKKEDLYPGLHVYVPTLFDYFIGIVQDDLKSALSENGNLSATLEFDTDDRHCWTTSLTINVGAMKRLKIYQEDFAKSLETK